MRGSLAKLRFTAMMILLGALWACTSVQPRPGEWPEPVTTTGDCLPPTGRFDNLGSWWVDGEEDQRLLAALFFPLGNQPLSRYAERESVTHVEIDQEIPSKIQVQAFVGPDLLFKRLIDAGAEGCVEGRFAFNETDWILEGMIGGVARVKSSYQAMLDASGALMLRQSERGLGLVFGLVPIAGSATSWLRFPAVSSSVPHPWPPEGVRERPAAVWHLLPPAGSKRSSSYDLAQACLARAVDPIGMETPLAEPMMGLDSDEFLTGHRDGTLNTPGWADAQHGWIPGSHDLRIRKQHWAEPALGRRYLQCLLDKGFSAVRRPTA